MPRRDKTFSGIDVIRIYEQNLTESEQLEVYNHICPETISSDYIIRFDTIGHLLRGIESIMDNLKFIPLVVRAAFSTIIMLNEIRELLIQAAQARLTVDSYGIKVDSDMFFIRGGDNGQET